MKACKSEGQESPSETGPESDSREEDSEMQAETPEYHGQDERKQEDPRDTQGDHAKQTSSQMHGNGGISKSTTPQTFISFQELFSTVKVYREVMEILRGPPSQTRKCHMIEIDWMRRFQAFGAACEKFESQLTSMNVRISSLGRREGRLTIEKLTFVNIVTRG